MKLRLIVLTLVVALVGVCVGPMAASAASPPGPTAATGVTTNGATVSGSEALARLNPFANVAVSGTATRPAASGTTAAATPAGTFSGHVTVLRFAVQNGHLVALVAVNGSVATATGSQAVSTITTTPALVSGTCNVLTLTLNPLHLNLLGLVIDTSQINLIITGQTGPGQLLGNLVCAIAGILHSPGLLAQLLNQLLTGIAEALVVLNTHFAVQNGQLVAITTLGNQVLGTAPAQVTQPTPGTCSVLNLVLGPLHLDLLGLIIDLNGGTDANGNPLPLTVTITAQPGTLLGGLVCDIANLLNASPPNLSGIANLLNLLVAILRI